MVQFQNVSKIYDNKIAAVNDVSFNVNEGEFVFLIGPSGSGKTTIIKMLIRDEVPSEGSIYFGDKDITKVNRSKVYKLRREVGVIFQDFKLVQDKTAYENVAFAMEAAGKKDQDISETVPYVLDIVGLSNRMKAFPRQLSGGEQQRVAIARAIANNPKILIADEPTGNLDPASAWDIVQILSKINNWGTTIIMSTHGTDIVNSLNKRVIQMDGGKVIRDDNKGQYEMTSSFEDLVNENNDTLIDAESGGSTKKTTFSFKIPKLEEPVVEEKEKEKKKGFFARFFGGFSRKRDIKSEQKEVSGEEAGSLPPAIGDQTHDSSERAGKPEAETQEEVPGIKDQTSESEESVARVESKDQSSQQSSEEESNEGNVGIEELPEPNEESNDISNIGLAEDRSRRKDKVKEKEKDKDGDENHEKFEKVVNSEDKTSISELNLPKQVKKDLKSAGFKYIEDVIKVGPEGLSESLVIDPDEIVLVAKEIKRFIEGKDQN